METPLRRAASRQVAPWGHERRVQWYHHGTCADVQQGDRTEPGYASNVGSRRKADHASLTATVDGTVWGAELALGEGPGRIYVVEPTGPIGDDPNLTDKKVPGNPTRSHRPRDPLVVVVVGVLAPWEGHAPDVLQAMKDNVTRARESGMEAIDD